MENLVIKGTITTTSNKISNIYRGEVPSKTAYVTVNKKDVKNAKEFGIKFYTPEDGEDFAIIKFSRNVEIYDSEKDDKYKVDGTTNSNNFKTTGECLINVVKGEKASNTFLRLQAIKLIDDNEIEFITQEDPFKDYK